MLLRSLLAVVVLLASGCSYLPRPVEGVPSGDPWAALPLKRWIGEGRIAPEAVAGCWTADCPSRLAVGVFRASGEEAEALARVLADPERLARVLRNPPPPRAGPARARKPEARVPIEVSAAPLAEGAARGFLVTLARRDGSRPPVHGAAFGARDADGLGVVIAVGERADAVERAARRAARGHLGGG